MDQPREPRQPVNLRIKFRSASLDQFVERYAVDVSRGGIFIRTREPLAVGTQLRLDFKLQDAQQLLVGEGTVVWVREPDPAKPHALPGMGVRFDQLNPESQETLERILSEKMKREKQGPAHPGASEAGGVAVRRPSSSFSAIESQLPKKADDAAAGTPSPIFGEVTGPTTTASAINYRDLVAKSARPLTPGPTPVASAAAPPTSPVLGAPKPFIAGTPPMGQDKVELPSANELDEAFAGMVSDSGPSRVPAAPTPPAGQPAVTAGPAATDTYRAPAFRTGRRITGSVAINVPDTFSPATRPVDEPNSEPTLIADTPQALLAAAKRRVLPSDEQPTPGPEMLASLDLFSRGAEPRDESVPEAAIIEELTAPAPTQGAKAERAAEAAAPLPVDEQPTAGRPVSPPPPEPTEVPTSLASPASSPHEMPTVGSLRESEPPPTASGVFTSARVLAPEPPRPPKSAVIVEGRPPGASAGGSSSKAPLVGGLLAAGGLTALILWKLGVFAGGAAPQPAPTAPAATAETTAIAPATTTAAPPSPTEATGGAMAPSEAPAAVPSEADSKPAKTAAEPTVLHQLRVITTPGGAAIAIDGKNVGRAPYVDKNFDVSAMHTVSASKDGFERWEMSVSAEDEWQRIKTAKGSALDELVLKPKLKRAIVAAPKPRPKSAPKAPVAGAAGAPSLPGSSGASDSPANLEPPKLDVRANEPAPEKLEKSDKPDKPEKAPDKAERPLDKAPDKAEKPAEKGDKDAPLPPS